MDIKGNPGPQRNENDALSRNQHCLPCCSHQTSHSRKPLSVFYANARSIVNKRHLLDLELSKRPFDIIVLMETHLDDAISDAEIFPENYTVFRRDRSQNGRQGGGILIATSEMSHHEMTYCVTLNSYLSTSTPLQERLSLWEFSIDLQTVI